ncbi:hypothetical protein BH10BDE1_BH10BDE1_34020 [soil metagenome]
MKSFTVAALLIVVGSISFAQTSKSVSFEELCKYEKNCQLLKDSGGFIKPKKKILLLMTELRDPIKSISKKLGVDPRAVAGAIVAENTLNVQVDDDIQDWLVKLQITPTASILGKSFTIGLGQIHVEAAQQVEAMIAKLERRKTRTSKEIADALLTPIGAISYAAGIVRKSQDDYKAQGIDVSDKPEILATLYNLGNTDAKAKTAQANKKAPRPNYFGFFVQQNIDAIADSIDWKRAPDPVVTVATLPAAGTTTTTNPLSESVGTAGTAAAAPVMRTVLNKAVQLSSFTPQCSTAGPGITSEYTKYATMQKSPSNVSAQGEYEVVSRGLDCEMSPWVLIRTKDGKIGWLDEKTLKSASEKRSLASAATCDPTSDSNCVAAVSKIVGKGVLGETKSKLLELKLVGEKQHPDKVNMKKFHPEICFNKNKNMIQMGGNGQPKQDFLSAEDAEAFAKKFDEKKPAIVKSMGLDKWESPQNFVRSDIDSLISSLRGQCKEGCKGPVENVRVLEGMDFAQFKGLAGFKKFKTLGQGSGFYFSPGKVDPTANLPAKDKWLALFAQIDTECVDVMKISKRSSKALKETKRAFDDTIKQFPSFSMEPSTDIVKTCENLGKILKRREAKKAAATADPNLPLEAKTDAACANCQIQMTIAYGNGGSMSSFYSMDVMEAVLQKDDDFDEMLIDSITNMKRYFATSQASGTEMMDCEYDPFESAKRVEDLLKLPCVESAYVPDMFILRKLDQYQGRVFHMPFVEDDRFAVRLKGSCEGVSK